MPDVFLIGKAFATSLALGLVVALLVGKSSRAAIASAGAALAAVSAVFAGLWVLGLLPNFPPREALDRLLLIVLPAAVVAEVVAAQSGRAGWVARCVVAALAVPVLLDGSVYVTDLSGPGSREWPPAKTWLVFAALAAVLMSVWMVTNRLAARTGGRTALWCVAGSALGAGLVIMLSGYATGGQLGVPLAAGLGGVALGSLIRREKPAIEGALGVGVVGLFALLVVGRLFAGLTDLNAALLFAAPLLGWLPELLPWRPRIRVPLRLALAAVPVVVALVLAQQKFATDSAPPESGIEGSLDDYMNFGK
jgi:hypothetical protein